MSMTIAFVGGAIIERVLIRPVEEARSPLNVVIVTLGMFLAINSLAQLVFGTDPQTMPKPWPTDASGNDETISIFGQTITWSVIALAIVLAMECRVALCAVAAHPARAEAPSRRVES